MLPVKSIENEASAAITSNAELTAIDRFNRQRPSNSTLEPRAHIYAIVDDFNCAKKTIFAMCPQVTDCRISGASHCRPTDVALSIRARTLSTETKRIMMQMLNDFTLDTEPVVAYIVSS